MSTCRRSSEVAQNPDLDVAQNLVRTRRGDLAQTPGIEHQRALDVGRLAEYGVQLLRRLRVVLGAAAPRMLDRFLRREIALVLQGRGPGDFLAHTFEAAVAEMVECGLGRATAQRCDLLGVVILPSDAKRGGQRGEGE